MSRRQLDVEEQLRQFQEEQKKSRGAPTLGMPELSFVQWAYFYPVVGIASTIAVTTLLVGIAMCLRVLPRREDRDAAQTVSLLASQASVIATTLTPCLCTLAFVLWIALIGTHAVFSAMKLAAYTAHEGTLGAALPIRAFALSSSALAFALELGGVIALWVYLLYFGGRLQLGAALSLVPFFPALYESMLLSGAEPDRSALWITHFVFLPSLFMVFALAKPFVLREYQNARAQLHNHTQSALYRDRPEFSDLRARARYDLQKRKQQ